MKILLRLLAVLAALSGPSLCHAQGTLPIALQQQFSFTNCATFTNACGTPLSGGLLYFYQVGTVATQQDSFQDTGLTIKNPWPLVLDANGRIPSFYLANGSVHVRLTDSSGVPQFDVPSQLVIGPSGGSGAGGGVDPTAIASTGDIKFRPTSELVSGWVMLNGLTIGSATSGATQRAATDTQNLFVYLWNNCPDAHCPVVGGRGATGLADFQANKQITLLDMRGRAFTGLDNMGTSAAGRIASTNVTSGGSDTTTTPGATGGEANHTLTVAELAQHFHAGAINDPGHVHGQNANTFIFSGSLATGNSGPTTYQLGGVTNSATTGVSFQDGAGNTGRTGQTGNGNSHNTMMPFMLGTWYQKL